MSLNAKKKKIVGLGAAAVTLTEDMSDSVQLFDTAIEAFTLPVITALNIGMKFTFVTTVAASTAQSVTAGAAADLYTGGVRLWDDTAAYTAPQVVIHKADVSNDIILTMNGTTKGGKIGSKVTFTAISATRWFVDGDLFGSGNLSTTVFS